LATTDIQFGSAGKTAANAGRIQKAIAFSETLQEPAQVQKGLKTASGNEAITSKTLS
jgi:hypothetical protein